MRLKHSFNTKRSSRLSMVANIHCRLINKVITWSRGQNSAWKLKETLLLLHQNSYRQKAIIKVFIATYFKLKKTNKSDVSNLLCLMCAVSLFSIKERGRLCLFRQHKKHISDGILHSNPTLNLKELQKKQRCESSKVMCLSRTVARCVTGVWD